MEGSFCEKRFYSHVSMSFLLSSISFMSPKLIGTGVNFPNDIFIFRCHNTI